MNKHHVTWFMAAGMASVWLASCGTPAPQPKAHVNSSKSSSKKAPAKTPKTAEKASTSKGLKVIAFYDQTMSSVAPDPFALLKAHPGLVDFLSPFWYEVSPTGTIIAKPQGNAAVLAKQDHLPLMPLFNNAGATDAFLQTAALRTAAIDNIVSTVKSHNYPAVQIDFQQLKSTDRTKLTAFMTQLQKALPKNVTVSMSVVPLTSGNGASAAYDFAALDKVVNSMVLMAYDFHGDGTPPGPVSPYDWVIKSIQTALKAGIQPSKLYLGIADYGYLWTGTSTKAITIPLKVMYQHKYGAYTWSPTYKEAYDKYTSKGVTHTIWFVNDRAAKDRIDLAKKYHLGGVAFWRVGYEDARWWNTVSKTIGGTSPSSAQSARSSTSPQYAKRTVSNTKKTVIAPAKKAGNTVKKDVSKVVNK